MKVIPHSRPSLGKEEEGEVLAVLKSGQIGQGRIVKKAEKSFANFIGVKGALLVNSGTAACHLALLSLGIKEKDEVILPSYVCPALLNAIGYTGAKPILCEVKRTDFNLDPAAVKKKINRRTKAIIVPHLFGAPADFKELAKFKIPLIEDISQKIGGNYRGKKIGSLGKVSICSFYATKLITCGEGGIAFSDDEILLKKMRDLRDYDEKENYLLRYNYKLTEMQASILLVQLKKLSSFIARRKNLASEYNEAFSRYNIRLPSGKGHVFYRYVLRIPENRDLKKIILLFQKKGIICRRPVYKPLHRYLRQKGFPVTEAIWHSALSLPLYPSLRKEESKRIISAGKSIFSQLI